MAVLIALQRGAVIALRTRECGGFWWRAGECQLGVAGAANDVPAAAKVAEVIVSTRVACARVACARATCARIASARVASARATGLGKTFIVSARVACTGHEAHDSGTV